MNSQTFTLRLLLPPGMTSDEAIELLGAADCTDPLVGSGEPSILALMFDGPVELAKIADAARAIPRAVMLSLAPGNEART